MKPFVFRKPIGPRDQLPAVELLHRGTGLPKGRIKRAMVSGAVWLQPPAGRGKAYRLRRATTVPVVGSQLALYYDEDILIRKPRPAKCLRNYKRYSVWYKPAGLMSQGTQYGDHCSLLRQAETHFRNRQRIFLVHRLDREAVGLVILAHDKDAAAKLSDLFASRRIVKCYRIEVLGQMDPRQPKGAIVRPIDGKSAVTDYVVRGYDPDRGTTTADVVMKTGRRHQIRRHFEMIGHPIMGDPLYGSGNKNQDGMRLTAVGLEFFCPFSKQKMAFELDVDTLMLRTYMTDSQGGQD